MSLQPNSGGNRGSVVRWQNRSPPNERSLNVLRTEEDGTLAMVSQISSILTILGALSMDAHSRPLCPSQGILKKWRITRDDKRQNLVHRTRADKRQHLAHRLPNQRRSHSAWHAHARIRNVDKLVSYSNFFTRPIQICRPVLLRLPLNQAYRCPDHKGNLDLIHQLLESARSPFRRICKVVHWERCSGFS